MMLFKSQKLSRKDAEPQRVRKEKHAACCIINCRQESGENDMTNFERQYTSNRFGVEGTMLLLFFAQSSRLCAFACAFVFGL
ncbi:MAG: hypothetical protein ACRENG_22895 [bacterium]